MTTRPLRLYVASSWRNTIYPNVVLSLRAAGFDPYDFRNPGPDDHGFSWREIDPNWQSWTPAEYVAALSHPAAERGFKFDMDAIKWCDACVLVQPCGRSAHLELGWAAGAGKPTFVLLAEGQEPELMVKMCTKLCTDISTIIGELLACQDAMTSSVSVVRYATPIVYPPPKAIVYPPPKDKE